jgi:hypothetical protein
VVPHASGPVVLVDRDVKIPVDVVAKELDFGNIYATTLVVPRGIK